jgi:transcriptional regulator with XRE-family HTH domain
MATRKNGKTKTITITARFARNVCKLRKQKNLSQSSFGKRIGCSTSYVSMMERNLRAPTLERLEQIAKGLRVKPAALIG